MTVQAAAANADYGTTASGSSFYAAMRILPRSQRDAMFLIYSFCRQVDDIADALQANTGKTCDCCRRKPQRGQWQWRE